MEKTEQHHMLGHRLRMARKEKGLTLCEVEQKTGLKASEISMIENAGRKNPGIFKVSALASFYGVSLDELIGCGRP